MKFHELLKSDYTRGPWIVATSCSWRRIYTERGQSVIVPTNHPIDNHPDLLASNADLELAAAAPELLAEVGRLQNILGIFKCPDNPGGFHNWDGDGECLDCCNYATDLSDAALKALRKTRNKKHG